MSALGGDPERAHPLAGPSRRMLAYGIDLIPIALLELTLLLVLLVATPLGDAFVRFARAFSAQDADALARIESAASSPLWFAGMTLAQAAVEWIYFTFFEMALSGRSPGKLALGMRVLRDGGRPLTLGASALRNLMRAVDMLPSQYLLGFVAIVLSRERKRLGDRVAGTIVVSERRGG